MKIVYEGLTIINFPKISAGLDQVINELETDAVAILFDEWSQIELTQQPLFAEMIRSTLIVGRGVFLKFGCIPFLTRLSTQKPSGHPIGFPIGDEVFVDVDLDRFFNPYLDPKCITLFLLGVLQKHLGAVIRPLHDARLNEAATYFLGSVFEAPKAITELVRASAGVPRDFLRIFARAFHKTAGKLPVTTTNVRLATQEFYQEEKLSRIAHEAETKLFDNIFDEICQPTNTYLFFVSQQVGKARALQLLLHNRLIHLLHQGHFAYAGETAGTYDVYVIDYGRYIQMESTKKGAAAAKSFSAFMDHFLGTISFTIKGIWDVDKKLEKGFSTLFATTAEIDSPDLERRLEDCSDIVADRFVEEHVTVNEE